MLIRPALAGVILCLSFAPLLVSGQRDSLTVTAWDFAREVHRGTQKEWNRVTVEMRPGVNRDPGVHNPNFHFGVVLQVTVAWRTRPGSGPTRMIYYRARAEAVALERDKTVTWHFFLPPELVDSDDLEVEPVAALAEVGTADRMRLAGELAAWGPIQDEARRVRFLREAEAQLAETSGALRAFPWSPFADGNHPTLAENQPTLRLPQ